VFGGDYGGAGVSASYARDQIVREFAAALVGPAEKTNAEGEIVIVPPDLPSTEVAWSRFESAVRALGNGGEKFGRAGKTALKLLGYHVPTHTHEEMHDTDRTAIWLFQRAMGLKADQIPGPKMRQALIERLSDRGVLRV
jgi:hypothetical protein